MAQPRPDPGYGSALAPLGSEEWAKRWRLEFQNVVKSLPQAPERSRRFFDVGQQYRAWTLVRDADDKPFADFDAFCRYRQPYGLGMDPAKFRAYLEAEVGKKAADLATVAPGDDKGGRPRKGEETADTVSAVSGAAKRKAERLRAILRAPEVVQHLYRDGLLAQQDAARMGPKAPTPERAAHLAEVRQRLERLDRTLPKAEFRRLARDLIGGRPDDNQLAVLRRAWAKASPAERAAFLAEVAPQKE